MTIRIGIDVGGTNTDAVFLSSERVIAAAKSPTTADVTTGIQRALTCLIGMAPEHALAAKAVIVGTTQFVNAVVERRRLNKVTAVRIGLPAAASVQPFADWPEDLRSVVRQETFMVTGGYEVDGRELMPIDEGEIKETARRIVDSGVEALAITGVFSPLRDSQEVRVAEILRDTCPGVHISLSSELGRIGLLERENATLLNAALTKLARVVVAGLHDAIASAGLKARLFLSQNDGTMISAEAAQHRPIFCFTSGPTNSMRGAALLSGVADGIVIDVGGTTADVGVLQAGFPREANSVVEVAGVRTLFRMPDTISVAIGGGSRVHSNPPRIGPDSVAYHIARDALVFGGDQLTATDVAVALGWVELGNVERVRHIDRSVSDAFAAAVRNRLEEVVDRLKTRADAVPVVAVGGASFLIPEKLSGVSEVIHVAHHDVANAVGAANAKVGGEVDQVFRDVARDTAIERATELALARAVQAGARPDTVKIVEKEDLPLSYVSGNTRRIRIRAAGDFA